MYSNENYFEYEALKILNLCLHAFIGAIQKGIHRSRKVSFNRSYEERPNLFTRHAGTILLL